MPSAHGQGGILLNAAELRWVNWLKLLQIPKRLILYKSPKIVTKLTRDHFWSIRHRLKEAIFPSYFKASAFYNNKHATCTYHMCLMPPIIPTQT